MIRSSLLVLPLLLTACSSTGGSTPAADDMPMEMPAPEQAGENHAWLQAGVGRFEGTMTNFMPGMGTEPVPATDTIVAFGPFWTLSTFECEFMGAPYMGKGSLGYDAASGAFVGTWTDSMSSAMAIMEGEQSEDGTLVMRWHSIDPASGESVLHRSETVRDSSGGYTMTFFMGEGEGVKSMQLDMDRVGS